MPPLDIFSGLENFQSLLLGWFKENKRPLPWRTTYNPYHVWISEIMLQQTQMERGVACFLRWIDRFPTVEDVALADEQEILKMWEGLGYYTRARNLHKSAKLIVSEYGGIVPDSVTVLRRLPGIGAYTSAAIASVAGNVTVPAVDANVVRILVRLLDIDRPVNEKEVQSRVHQVAEQILPAGQARFWNQALMDLGGMVCTARNPKCGLCPVSNYCLATERGVVAERPRKAPKKKIRKIERVGLFLLVDSRVAIRQCEGKNNLWKGLWELPGLDLKESQSPEEGCRELLSQFFGKKKMETQLLGQISHSYTTNRVELYPFLVEAEAIPEGDLNLVWCDVEQLEKYSFAAGTRKTLEYVRAHRRDIIAF